MSERPPPKARSYGVDRRHLLPMVRDVLELVTVRLADPAQRRHAVQLGRDARQHAFNARDPLPVVEHRDLAAYLGCTTPAPIVLPPIDTISLSGLGFVQPYALLATVVGALAPGKIFEIGTFRGVGALTMALNAPTAEVYTLDLPQTATEAETTTLSRGDREWVRLSRTSVGFAFRDHPAGARIHQLYGDSLTFEPPAELAGCELCFIDGGHSYECIAADTETALRVLAPGGVIVWDDYSWFVEGVRRYLLGQRGRFDLRRIAGSHMVLARLP